MISKYQCVTDKSGSFGSALLSYGLHSSQKAASVEGFVKLQSGHLKHFL